MLDRNAFGPLVAEYEGWKIFLNESPNHHFNDKCLACVDGIIMGGDSIEEVVQQIASRVGELNRKEGAWSGGISSDH